MIITCPECEHDFENFQLNVKSYDERFTELLTAPAKRVFATKLPQTEFMTLACATCKTEELVTLPQQVSLTKFGSMVTPDDAYQLWPEHGGHDVKLDHKQVHYMSGYVSVSLAATMTAAMDTMTLMEKLVDRRLRVMAHVFNEGVAEGWIKWGVLGGPFVVDMAVMNPSVRKIVALYFGTDIPIETPNDYSAVRAGIPHRMQQDWLNKKYGHRFFVAEGELGVESDWDDFAEKFRIA